MAATGNVTRAELAAHLRRLDENIDYIRSDIAEINERLGAPSRWVGARLARLIDYGLVALLAAGIAVVAAHFTA